MTLVPGRLYEEFFRSAPVGCGISDARGNLIAFNQAMLDYSGWTREEIERIGNVAALYADPGDRERLLARAVKEGGIRHVEVRFRKKDGGTFWSSFSLRPIDIEGERYWLAVTQDISERKRADTEREERLGELERLTRMMVDRENRMVALKDELERLKAGREKDAP